MTKKGKEFRSNFLSRNPQFKYLPDKDRYLFAIDKPKYKFNIIGAGIMGQEHMKVTMLEGRGTIHGIYDPNPLSIGVAKHLFSQISPENNLVVYNSLEAACNDPEVDGLIICTPNYTHIDVVKEAVKSGKHILLEKPMATTIPDAYEITQMAQNYSAVFQVGLQYRYKAISVEAIYEALERKTLGDIKLISFLEHRGPFLDKVNQWNKFTKYSGGTLVEKCCHYFDLINLFAQSKPLKVHATGSMAVNFINFEYNNEKSDIIDNAIVSIVYENGIHASFNLCMFAPMFYEELIVCGDKGRLKAYENMDFLPATRPKTHLEIMRGESKPSRITNPMYPAYIEETGHSGSTFYEHVYFIDNIEGKKTNTATADEGFWSIVVGAAAEVSIKREKVIFIDELLKEIGLSSL
ncbi:MAG: Gfo/Idh/MocA family protein [Candidatus Hermodarchaeota archaeon]